MEGRAGLEVMGYRHFWNPLGTECKDRYGFRKQVQAGTEVWQTAAGGWVLSYTDAPTGVLS